LESVAVAPPRSTTAATALYNLGNLQHEQGNTDGALVSLSKAIEIDNTQTDALYNMGVIYQEKGAFEKALNCYEQAATADPTFEEAQAAMDCMKEYMRRRKKKSDVITPAPKN